MALVGMATKPLHVRRLQKALQEWVTNPREFKTSSTNLVVSSSSFGSNSADASKSLEVEKQVNDSSCNSVSSVGVLPSSACTQKPLSASYRSKKDPETKSDSMSNAVNSEPMIANSTVSSSKSDNFSCDNGKNLNESFIDVETVQSSLQAKPILNYHEMYYPYDRAMSNQNSQAKVPVITLESNESISKLSQQSSVLYAATSPKTKISQSMNSVSNSITSSLFSTPISSLEKPAGQIQNNQHNLRKRKCFSSAEENSEPLTKISRCNTSIDHNTQHQNIPTFPLQNLANEGKDSCENTATGTKAPVPKAIPISNRNLIYPGISCDSSSSTVTNIYNGDSSSNNSVLHMWQTIFRSMGKPESLNGSFTETDCQNYDRKL